MPRTAGLHLHHDVDLVDGQPRVGAQVVHLEHIAVGGTDLAEQPRECTRSILDPPGPITRETVIAGTVPPNYPGSEEAHEFLHRILVVSAEKPNLRARVGEIINDWLDATEEIVTAIVARMDPEEQFDPRIYTIFLVQHGWLANDLRGDRRITNDEFYDFVRHLITNVPPARPVGLDGT